MQAGRALLSPLGSSSTHRGSCTAPTREVVVQSTPNGRLDAICVGIPIVAHDSPRVVG